MPIIRVIDQVGIAFLHVSKSGGSSMCKAAAANGCSIEVSYTQLQPNGTKMHNNCRVRVFFSIRKVLPAKYIIIMSVEHMHLKSTRGWSAGTRIGIHPRLVCRDSHWNFLREGSVFGLQRPPTLTDAYKHVSRRLPFTCRGKNQSGQGRPDHSCEVCCPAKQR